MWSAGVTNSNSAPTRSGGHYGWHHQQPAHSRGLHAKTKHWNITCFAWSAEMRKWVPAPRAEESQLYNVTLYEISGFKIPVATSLGCRVITVVGMCGVPWQASRSKSRRRKTEAGRETAEVGWRFPLSPCFCAVVEAHLWSSKPHSPWLRLLFQWN